MRRKNREWDLIVAYTQRQTPTEGKDVGVPERDEMKMSAEIVGMQRLC
jgi:hypothetical protein